MVLQAQAGRHLQDSVFAHGFLEANVRKTPQTSRMTDHADVAGRHASTPPLGASNFLRT